MGEKERLDVRMIRDGLAVSREKAKDLVRRGRVTVNGKTAVKAGQAVEGSDQVIVQQEEKQFVSRGGHKLAKALEVFGIMAEGCICLDAGASTGGFTDCLLQQGAALVYAVDVGHGQLDSRLAADPRVISREKVNVRYMDETDVPQLCDLAVADLSYISLTKVLPALAGRLKPEGSMICLIKPQFEAGPGAVDKKGVIKNPTVHGRVIKEILKYCEEQDLSPVGLTFSPIRGPEGNIEYLIWIKKTKETASVLPKVESVVAQAHQALD